MSAGFTLDAYRRLLTGFAERGYAVRGYADAAPDRRDLILRHDLDMSPAYAPPMAELEAGLGFKATYFVLVRSELYNPIAPRSAAYLRRVLASGHALGLHLDASLYPDTAALETGAEGEVEALERFFAARIEAVSFHRPGRHLLDGQERIAGRLSTYARRYFSDMGYCSDSRGGWHRGEPLAHPAVRAGRALQLLTHPIWWAGEAAEPAARLHRYMAECVHALDSDLAANCEVHKPGRARLSFDGDER